ncbi:MAG TPA: DUF6491 family protein [Sphingobium sp.]|nr:DUF6491 family protein [Sphingobium sp.]
MSQFNRFAFATLLATAAFVASGGLQAAGQAVAAEEAAAANGAEAAIPFANRGGVRDWEAVGDDKLYIQDAQRKWYLATLAMAAPDLPFATNIGFETKGVDRLDKFGIVVIAGTRYPLKSLVNSGPPPAKPKK